MQHGKRLNVLQEQKMMYIGEESKHLWNEAARVLPY